MKCFLNFIHLCEHDEPWYCTEPTPKFKANYASIKNTYTYKNATKLFLHERN